MAEFRCDRWNGHLSYVQFQLLARLAVARGQLTMTELADGVVYSRNGPTYRAACWRRPASSPSSPASVTTCARSRPAPPPRAPPPLQNAVTLRVSQRPQRIGIRRSEPESVARPETQQADAPLGRAGSERRK